MKMGQCSIKQVSYFTSNSSGDSIITTWKFENRISEAHLRTRRLSSRPYWHVTNCVSTVVFVMCMGPNMLGHKVRIPKEETDLDLDPVQLARTTKEERIMLHARGGSMWTSRQTGRQGEK